MIQLDVLAIGARLVVGITLIVAAHAKLRDLHAFADGVHDYGVLPPSTEKPVARLVPWIELALGVCVLAGVALPWTAVTAAAMFAVFGLAMAGAVRRGKDIACHCFSASDTHRVGLGAVARDGVLVALAMIAAAGPALAPRQVLGSTAAILSVAAWAAALALAVVVSEPLGQMVTAIREANRRSPRAKAILARRASQLRDANGAEERLHCSPPCRLRFVTGQYRVVTPCELPWELPPDQLAHSA
jgi:hypothetical protein